jgi:hypothetical protein
MGAIDSEPTFETEEAEGSSLHFNGIVGASPIAIPPATSGHDISSFLIHNPPSNPHGSFLFLSLDGGAGYMLIENKTYIGFSIEGCPKQVFLKSNVSGANYELVLNFNGDT